MGRRDRHEKRVERRLRQAANGGGDMFASGVVRKHQQDKQRGTGKKQKSPKGKKHRRGSGPVEHHK